MGDVDSERLNRDDLGQRRRRFVRLGYPPVARIARQDQAALGAHRRNEIHAPGPAAYEPCRDNDRCQMPRIGLRFFH
jgi:hypothetical protein